MEYFELLGMVGSLGGVALVLGLRRLRARTQWPLAARKLGLHLGNDELLLFGTVDGLSVDVSYQKGEHRSFTRFVVQGPAVYPHLALASEGLWKSLARVFSGGAVKTGGAALDEGASGGLSVVPLARIAEESG